METSHYEAIIWQVMMKKHFEWLHLQLCYRCLRKMEMTLVKSPEILACHGPKTIEE
jgi:hypothetical protein